MCALRGFISEPYMIFAEQGEHRSNTRARGAHDLQDIKHTINNERYVILTAQTMAMGRCVMSCRRPLCVLAA